MEFSTGSLVQFRDRPWVVQRSDDNDVVVLKPLGGTDHEVMGLYKPLYGDQLELLSYDFRKPDDDDLLKGYPGSDKLLYNACRLSFRDIAGPFQCLGKLSFTPRPYQMVPLILALKQKRIRLLIGDDVGIGKTLESLLIAKELLDRKEISSFSVLCLPHLCEQWQNEIKDKFGLEAVIVRGSTVSGLEKNLRNGQNVFRSYPFQVISIDYIKQDNHRQIFLDHCPEFVIVDEAHTCARPRGANKSQQLRYNLLSHLAETDRHIVMLTATPHSGQEEEFQSIIGMLDPKFENLRLSESTPQQREELAKYFIQRRRADIQDYLGSETSFPERIQIDDNKHYQIAPEYKALISKIVSYAKNNVMSATSESKLKQRYIYWEMLALIRGVMSSPAAGISMFRNKLDKRNETVDEEETDITESEKFEFSIEFKDLPAVTDVSPEFYSAEANKTKRSKLQGFIDDLQSIMDFGLDYKVDKALEYIKICLDLGKNPIVFCQYIQTAEYLGAKVKEAFATGKYKKVAIEVITSTMADEQRKDKIDELSKTEKHVLVCTDCLSEGVNLQDGFEAVIHYDLPWNPNRMEQRNGRIDRFGQSAKEVLVSSIYATNNPMDMVILKVLYDKQEQIRKSIGVYLPIAEDDSSVMEAVMKRIFSTSSAFEDNSGQLTLAFEDFEEDTAERDKALTRSVEIEKKSHTYFAHNNKQADPTKLEASLRQVKDIIGDVDDTADFVVGVLKHMGAHVKTDAPLCYSFDINDLPNQGDLRHYFEGNSLTKRIAFCSPTPKGYMYIGRNHTLVENYARAMVNDTVNGGAMSANRAMVTVTDRVKVPTTVILMRVRSVIRPVDKSNREIVGEEMIFFGYQRTIDKEQFIDREQCRDLFFNARSKEDLPIGEQRQLFDRYTSWVRDEKTLRLHTDALALTKAQELVEAHKQYRTYLQGENYMVVEPVLPMDVIACYVYLPFDN